MATDKSIVAFIVEQLSAAGNVSAKPMFGEYGLYCDGKMFGMICDGQLFIKPTAGGRTLGSDLQEASPYPGAKPCLLVDPDRWDDSDWLVAFIQVTVEELPVPKPKVRKSKPASGYNGHSPAQRSRRPVLPRRSSLSGTKRYGQRQPMPHYANKGDALTGPHSPGDAAWLA